mgnify:CR=1 FL=1
MRNVINYSGHSLIFVYYLERHIFGIYLLLVGPDADLKLNSLFFTNIVELLQKSCVLNKLVIVGNVCTLIISFTAVGTVEEPIVSTFDNLISSINRREITGIIFLVGYFGTVLALTILTTDKCISVACGRRLNDGKLFIGSVLFNDCLNLSILTNRAHLSS